MRNGKNACTVRNTRVGSVRHGFGVSTQHKIDPQELISRYCSCEYTRHPTPSVGNVTGTWGSPRLPVSGACPCALRVGESFILVQRDSFRRYLEKSPEYECSQQVRRCSSPFEAEGSSQRQAALPGQPFKIQFTIRSATSRTQEAQKINLRERIIAVEQPGSSRWYGRLNEFWAQ